MNTKQIQIRCKGTSTLLLDSLQNLQGNLKELRESEYKKLRKSIEKYGFRFPIFVWKNFILDGHQRIFTLKKMVAEGWSTDPIPVIEIEAENEKEAKRLVLLVSSRYGHVTDEGLYEFIMTSELDFDELKEEIDLPEIDFKQFEQNFFTEAPRDAEPQIDRAEELNKKWQVKTGDFWQIGEHRLLCGDSTKAEDVEKVMGGEKARAVITDPPWNVGWKYDGYQDDLTPDQYKKFSDQWRMNAEDICEGLFFVALSMKNYKYFYFWFPMAERIFAECQNFVQHTPGFMQYAFNPFLVWGISNKKSFAGKRDFYLAETSITKSTTDKQLAKVNTATRWLPTIEYIIDLVDDDGMIYDPFLGSGTTMIACQNLNRKCRGVEISAPYVAVCLERMAVAFPGIDIKKI